MRRAWRFAVVPPWLRRSPLVRYAFINHPGFSITNMSSWRRAAALGGRIESAFWFVAIAMGVSGSVLYRWGEETHPRLNPAL